MAVHVVLGGVLHEAPATTAGHRREESEGRRRESVRALQISVTKVRLSLYIYVICFSTSLSLSSVAYARMDYGRMRLLMWFWLLYECFWFSDAGCLLFLCHG